MAAPTPGGVTRASSLLIEHPPHLESPRSRGREVLVPVLEVPSAVSRALPIYRALESYLGDPGKRDKTGHRGPGRAEDPGTAPLVPARFCQHGRYVAPYPGLGSSVSHVVRENGEAIVVL